MRKAAPFVVLPFLFLALFQSFAAWRGPYFAYGNHDPEYAYLMNSLAVANLAVPWHRDHPGTSMQQLGAAVVRLTHPFASTDAMNEAVLRNPEASLRAMALALLALCALSLAVAGWLISREYASTALGLLFVAVPFLASVSWEFIGRFTPDLPLVALSALFCAASVAAPARSWPVVFGALCGVVVATKINGLPLFVFPLVLLLRSPKRFVPFVLSSGLAFFASAWPLLLKWKESAAYILNVPQRIGVKQAGSAQLPFSTWIAQAVSLVFAFPLVSLGLSISGFLVAIAGKRYLRRQRVEHKDKLAVISFLIIGLQIMAVASKPGARYLLPCYPVVALAMVLGVKRLFARSARLKVSYGLTAAMAIAGSVLVASSILRNPNVGEEYQAGENHLRETAIKAGCVIVELAPSYSNSNTSDFGLDWGDNFADKRFGSTLRAIYPEKRFYHPGEDQYYAFGERKASSLPPNKVCLRGLVGALQRPRFEEIARTKLGDALYLIR